LSPSPNGHLPTEAESSLQPRPRKPYDHPGPMRLDGYMARMRPPAADTILWDSLVPGFGLRCFASGAKSWVIRYRDRSARRLKTIGHPPALDVHRARRIAQALIAAAELDGLPLPEDTQVQEQVLFGAVVEELMGALARSWKSSTLKRNQDALRRELLPAFGEMPIMTILKPDVVRWRDNMASRPHAFNRALPVLSMLMQEAERFGYRKPSSNPCRLIPRYPRTKKERFLSHREYRSLAAVLKDAEGEMAQAVAIIRLLIYTGARSGEITGLRWEWIKPPRIFLPDSKTGAKVILLNASARAVLERVGQGTSEREGLVFPNSAGTAPMNIQPQWIALRARAGLRDVRLHDLRHSFASVAIREGISLVQIGRLLGHALPETTERYAHLADDDVAQAAERVSSAIAAGMGLQL